MNKSATMNKGEYFRLGLSLAVLMLVGYSEALFIDLPSCLLDGAATLVNSIAPPCCDKFQCASGTPMQNPDVNLTSNGCGTYGFDADKIFVRCQYMKNCCTQHDYCYNTCGSDKNDCDLELFYCTQNPPSSELVGPVCKPFGLIFYTLVQFLGCPAFNSSQYQFCECR